MTCTLQNKKNTKNTDKPIPTSNTDTDPLLHVLTAVAAPGRHFEVRKSSRSHVTECTFFLKKKTDDPFSSQIISQDGGFSSQVI